MITLTQLKNKLTENSGILNSFIYRGYRVVVSTDYSLTINEEKTGCESKSLEEAIANAREHIDTSIILENVGNTIPKEKIVALIEKYNITNKITDTLVEAYLDFASSNLFTIDPVLLEIKQKTSYLPGKIEHTLSDGNTVAINEETQILLNKLLEDKYQIVEYMRESKENFMRIIKEVT